MKTFKTHLLVALLASTGLGSAFAHGDHEHDDASIGKAGDAKKVTRTIHIDMNDTMRFTPAEITAKQNETIRFIVTNKGKVKHELVLGTEAALKEHNEVMKKNPEMEHEEPNEVSLAPGVTGEMIWQFTKAGRVAFACLQPGHFDAGMKGAVLVADSKGKVPAEKTKKSAASAPSNAVIPVAQNSATVGTSGPAVNAMDSTSAASVAAMSTGEVRKIDKEAGKITIKHGPLLNLAMPGMTMVFHVRDGAMLDQVKEGDKIKFVAEKVGGVLTVTKLEAVQ